MSMRMTAQSMRTLIRWMETEGQLLSPGQRITHAVANPTPAMFLRPDGGLSVGTTADAVEIVMHDNRAGVGDFEINRQLVIQVLFDWEWAIENNAAVRDARRRWVYGPTG